MLRWHLYTGGDIKLLHVEMEFGRSGDIMLLDVEMAVGRYR